MSTGSSASGPVERPSRPDVRFGAGGDGLVSFAERSFAAAGHHWAALVLVAGAAAAADQLTKVLVVHRLALGGEVRVVGPLAIHHVQNSGIAFGLFAGATAIVASFTALAVAWMLGVFARSGGRHPVLPVGLGLVIGGAISNLVDRVRLGHVTDFLDIGVWPAFNLADTFIVVGVAVLATAAVVSERAPSRPGRIAPETHGP